MRRPKKFGVYSNKTIRKCCCELSETVNKYYGEERLHQIGVGRLEENCKFVQFDKRNHYRGSYSRCEHQDEKHQKRVDNRRVAREGEKYFHLTNF